MVVVVVVGGGGWWWVVVGGGGWWWVVVGSGAGRAGRGEGRRGFGHTFHFQRLRVLGLREGVWWWGCGMAERRCGGGGWVVWWVGGQGGWWWVEVGWVGVGARRELGGVNKKIRVFTDAAGADSTFQSNCAHPGNETCW